MAKIYTRQEVKRRRTNFKIFAGIYDFIGVVAGTVVIEILAVMCAAYLAITLSATLLQNKRGFVRMLVSFVIFGILNYITEKVSGMVTWQTDPTTTQELLRMLGTQAAVQFSFAALFAGASAWMLDRKVSL